MNIIITGASKGIGKAVAEIFAANGHNLFLCARGEATLYKTMEELMTKYPSVSIKAKPVDVSKKKEAIAFGRWCLNYGTPDVLVNNAGLFEPGSVYNEPDGLLESQVETHLYGAYHLTRTVLPKMMQQNPATNSADRSGRHIFNLCSIASLDAYPDGGAYSISKFALYGFSKNLREEMKPYGIKVTHVIPGAAYTGSWSGSSINPKRIMEASDVAKMIYAASQLSLQACVEEIVIRPQLGDL